MCSQRACTCSGSLCKLCKPGLQKVSGKGGQKRKKNRGKENHELWINQLQRPYKDSYLVDVDQVAKSIAGSEAILEDLSPTPTVVRRS